jgi:hypothetical protein
MLKFLRVTTPSTTVLVIGRETVPMGYTIMAHACRNLIICLLLGQAHNFAFLPDQQPFVPFDSTIDDVAFVSRHWGQLSTYIDLLPGDFGVDKVGLPDGCQIEQTHLLQRHAERFPHPGDEQDGLNVERFTQKVARAIEQGQSFKGPLEFLNSWRNMLGGEFLTGMSFWDTRPSLGQC